MAWRIQGALCIALLAAAATAAGAQRVVVLTLDDTIQAATLRYLQRGLEVADESDAELVLIELNTPGGELTALRRMTMAITNSDVPVVVFVTPSGAQAASAGFFLLMAADVAAMAPGTNAGAAHPVAGGGADLPDTLKEKVTNDSAALIRSLAVQRNRPVEPAERAVRESVSYTAEEALEKKLIEVTPRDRDALLAWLNGREILRVGGKKETLDLAQPRTVRLEPNFSDKVLSVVANGNIAMLLFLVGVVGIGFELTHPGAIFPGVLGGIALLLAFFGLSVLPVNYVGILLMLLAIVFFALEVKVTSWGALTVAGLVSFILGALMLIDSPLPAVRVSLSVILPTAAVIAATVIFLVTRVVRTHSERPRTGYEGLIGEIGEVVVALQPEGKVFIHGEYWNAVASSPVPAGARVSVVGNDGRRLEVKAVAGAPGEHLD